jgi:hypothetical protein
MPISVWATSGEARSTAVFAFLVFANELNCCGQLAQAMCTEYGINVEPVCLKTFQSQLQQEFPLL